MSMPASPELSGSVKAHLRHAAAENGVERLRKKLLLMAWEGRAQTFPWWRGSSSANGLLGVPRSIAAGRRGSRASGT